MGAPDYPDTVSRGPSPLAGVQVISIATNVPGPVAVSRLVALGAVAIKVEPPAGDFLAFAARGWYDALRAGQEVVTLDLKRADEHALLDERLALADVLVTSHRPGALERLGLRLDTLAARFPRLCVVRIVGHGGDDGERPGHDLTYQAEAGLVVPPTLPTTLLVDMATGEAAAAAACALLVQRARTGAGGAADIVMAEVAHRMAAPRAQGLTSPGGLLGGALPQYGVYPARIGWIAIAALEPAFLQRLAAGLGLQDVTAEALTRAFGARTAGAWVAWGKAHDVPVAEVAQDG